EMGILRAPFWGPRPRRFRSIFRSAWGSAEKGVALAASRAVSSRTSPSRLVSGLRFAITLSLPLVRSAKTDDADSIWFGHITQQMQSPVQVPDCNAPCFAFPDLCMKHRG